MCADHSSKLITDLRIHPVPGIKLAVQRVTSAAKNVRTKGESDGACGAIVLSAARDLIGGKPCMDNHDSRSHWFTRRTLFGTAAGAALGAYGVSLGLAAEVPDVFDGTKFQLRAPEPNAKRGGVLRYGVLSAPAHFDVHQSGTVSNIGTQGCMYDNLIRRDPRDSGQSVIPDLAHSWEIAKDGKTYTFFLRKGVKFHDGGDFTAEDVKATYTRLITPPTGFSSPRTTLFAAVSEVNIRSELVFFENFLSSFHICTIVLITS